MVTFPRQRMFCVPPLLGAGPGSLSLGWGFQLLQNPWTEKPLTQAPGREKGWTLGQDLEFKLILHTPMVLF